MKNWPLIFGIALLAGCAHFKPQPLAPEKTAAQFEARRLDDAGLKKFLEQNLGHELQNWPETNWNFQELTLAAFYFQPSLEVARAQWRVAQAGIKTAGGRPNPTLSLTPGYDTTTAIPSPWFPAVNLDLPVETMGKRGKRIAEAKNLSESARLDIVTAAWKVRSDVRASLLDFTVAERRAAFLEKQLAAQQQIVKLLQQRLDAGEIARPEFTSAQIALNKTQIDVVGAQNDLMAMGARKAFEGVSNIADREKWLRLPFTGVDGLAKTGMAWVRNGTLTATVVVPTNTGQAISMLVEALQTGRDVPERSYTSPESFPAIEKLAPKSERLLPTV